MWQPDLFDTALAGGNHIPEANEAKLIELLAQLMLSTLSSTAAAEEGNSHEQD